MVGDADCVAQLVCTAVAVYNACAYLSLYKIQGNAQPFINV